MVSKGITLIEQTATFNKDIRYWRWQTTNLNKWDVLKTFSHQSHLEQSREATTALKGESTAAVQNIYGVPVPPPEDHYRVIKNWNNNAQ